MTTNETAFSQAKAVIPGGVDSPVRAFGGVGGTPRFIASASGARVTDVEGRSYVDLVGSWGPALLGHAHPAVVAAVQEAASRGLSFGAPTETETLLAAAPDVVIDVGEPKDSIAEDMDGLQEQTGIPFVHIDAYLASMDDTYAMLGDLLAMPNEAQGLADYCRFAYDRAVEIANSVEKANILYITGDEGLNVIAQGSYHAEVIDMLANNLAVVDEPSGKGTGNEVDMEQILRWNPDVILFASGSIYDTVADNENWQTLTAIKNGAYYEVPMGPYNWMGFPPSVQRLLGMMWMTTVLYPDAVDYDLYTEVSSYFQMFYHCELTRTQYDALVAYSLPAADAAA